MAILKQILGEAGAAIDESHGEDRLYDVLKALAQGPDGSASVQQATPTTGVKDSFVVNRDATDLTVTVVAKVDDAGSANATTVQARRNGTLIPNATVAISNTLADGSIASVEVDLPAVTKGDLIDLNVSVVATDATQLEATVRLSPVKVE